jgi:hypothetical protein
MRVVALTFVRKEPDFFPLWLKYYSKEVDECFVINPNQETYPGQWTEIKVYGDGGNSLAWGMIQINNAIKDLLSRFDWVVYSDVDEFIIPKTGDIKAFLKYRQEAMVTCRGFEPFQQDEPPIDLTKPILRQRKGWIPAHAYNKTIVTRTPIILAEGCHYTQDMYNEYIEKKLELRKLIESRITPDLYLVHLKRIDRHLFEIRNPKDWTVEINLLEPIPEWIKDRL